MPESDLYPPLKRFLEAQHYAVKGEVLDCDVLAVRDAAEPADAPNAADAGRDGGPDGAADGTVIVELKSTLNLEVVLQAVDRLQLAPTVYIGVPEGSPALQRHRRRAVKLLRMLGIGLLAIDPARDRVDVLLDPGPYRPRASAPRRGRLLGEFSRRVGDPNRGGSPRRQGVVTAYRQRALAIARHLDAHGRCKAAEVAQATGDPQARAVLYRDAYGWFERVDTGVYALSPRGRDEWRGWVPPAAPA